MSPGPIPEYNFLSAGTAFQGSLKWFIPAHCLAAWPLGRLVSSWMWGELCCFSCLGLGIPVF